MAAVPPSCPSRSTAPAGAAASAEPSSGVLGRPLGALARRRRRDDEGGLTSRSLDEEPVLGFIARVQLIAADERERSDDHPPLPPAGAATTGPSGSSARRWSRDRP